MLRSVLRPMLRGGAMASLRQPTARLGFATGLVAGSGAAFSFSFDPVAAAAKPFAGDKPLVIFVLGGPGAGKGTMCARLVQDFGFEHLSAGDLLRAERKKGGARGEMINDYINRGAIVPNEVTCQLLLDAMQTSPRTKFLVDGYPRNDDNREGWEKTVGDEVNVAAVLFFDCPEDILVQRIIKRGEEAGKDARSDDNAEAMVKRLRVYREQTGPVIDYFDKQGKVVRVNTGYDKDEVYEGVAKAVTPIVESEVLAKNYALLDCISAGDYDRYQQLTSEDVTCFDRSEAMGNLVEGRAFHKYYFDHLNAADMQASSTISQPSVKLLSPTVAVVAYVRVVQSMVLTRTGKRVPASNAFEETRVWQCTDGVWRNVHFHKSTASSA